MFSVTVFRFSFTSSWQMLGLAVLSICLFVCLGRWQIHRAEEKRHLLERYQVQMQVPPITIPGPTVQQYQRVSLRGQAALPLTLFLDNQHHAHQFGYDVLTPLLLADGNVILIDHGWVRGDPSRMVLPDIPELSQNFEYTGQAYYPPAHPLSLGAGLEVKSSDVIVIESLDLTTLGHFLHKTVYPFIIRQSEQTSSLYVRDWPIVAGSPTRHIGYAVQWFIFALIVFILYIILNVKRQS